MYFYFSCFVSVYYDIVFISIFTMVQISVVSFMIFFNSTFVKFSSLLPNIVPAGGIVQFDD